MLQLFCQSLQAPPPTPNSPFPGERRTLTDSSAPPLFVCVCDGTVAAAGFHGERAYRDLALRG